MTIKITILAFVFLSLLMGSLNTVSDRSYHPEFTSNSSGLGFGIAYAYPPGVGILSSSKNCVSCHKNNGPWRDDNNLIVDIIDKETQRSLRQPDGSFLISTRRYEAKTVYTIIGSRKKQDLAQPDKNSWLYIDTTTLGKNTLSKFAPGWEVNLPLSCRITGDEVKGYENSTLTSLPMTLRPLTDAHDGPLMLQVLLSKGDAAKQNTSSMLASYFERTVHLRIDEE
jgi:hypothetical protein